VGGLRGGARRWLSEALWDLDTATPLYEEEGGTPRPSTPTRRGKAVKALLYSVNEAPWGHSVRVLLERYWRAAGLEPEEGLLAAARELDRYC